MGWWEWYECLLRSILALCTPSVGPTIPSLGHHRSTGWHKNQTHVGLIFFAACKYFVFFWPLLCSFTLLLFDISADPASSFAADDVGCRVTSRPDWVSTRQAALLVRTHTQPVCRNTNSLITKNTNTLITKHTNTKIFSQPQSQNIQKSSPSSIPQIFKNDPSV